MSCILFCSSLSGSLQHSQQSCCPSWWAYITTPKMTFLIGTGLSKFSHITLCPFSQSQDASIALVEPCLTSILLLTAISPLSLNLIVLPPAPVTSLNTWLLPPPCGLGCHTYQPPTLQPPPGTLPDRPLGWLSAYWIHFLHSSSWTICIIMTFVSTKLTFWRSSEPVKFLMNCLLATVSLFYQWEILLPMIRVPTLPTSF